MKIIPYETAYAEYIATLLNNYLPFEPENAQTVDQAGGIRFICLEDEEVIGYIAGYVMTSFESDFPFFKQQLAPLKAQLADKQTFYTSHFVVHPAHRQKGIGSQLVQYYMTSVKEQADAVVVVGWVQSDSQKWAAARQFTAHQMELACYIPRYFEPYAVDCPNCQGLCYCDAKIMVKIYN